METQHAKLSFEEKEGIADEKFRMQKSIVGFDLFDGGSPASPELEALAEGGDVAPLRAAFGKNADGSSRVDTVAAAAGGFPGAPVFDPGETHTLVVPNDVDEMITLFQVNGVMYYVDPWGKHLGYEDVFTKIEMCRRHYDAAGLGANFVDQFIR